MNIKFPTEYEPKRNNRWIVSVPTLPEWVFQEIEFPSVESGWFCDKWSDIHATLLDVIGQSIPTKIQDLYKSGKFTFSIKVLDPPGAEVEHWEVVGKITHIHNGTGSYSNDGLKKISIRIKPYSVNLLKS